MVINMGYKQVTFRIEDSVADDLKAMAFNLKKTQSELVRRYIEDGLNKDKNQTKLDVK